MNDIRYKKYQFRHKITAVHESILIKICPFEECIHEATTHFYVLDNEGGEEA